MTHNPSDPQNPRRRALLEVLVAVPIAGVLGKWPRDGVTDLALTPPCTDDDDDPTPAQTEGPYFKRSSPQRTSLVESGITGVRLTLTGQVLTTACVPIAGALLDFWQADSAGAYDTAGYRLRGHQFTDANGRFTLQTIVPGLYGGRARHVHVKVQPRNGPVLTTQLYFPGEGSNTRDRIFAAALLLDKYQDGAGGKTGAFNFIVRT